MIRMSFFKVPVHSCDEPLVKALLARLGHGSTATHMRSSCGYATYMRITVPAPYAEYVHGITQGLFFHTESELANAPRRTEWPEEFREYLPPEPTNGS